MSTGPDEPRLHIRRKGGNGKSTYGGEDAMSVERDSPLVGIVRILGMPVGTLSALVLMIVFIFTVWLSHDRAIASQTGNQQQTETRVKKLEAHDEERTKSDAATAAALTRIEQKIDDLKERVAAAEKHRR